MTFDLPAWTPAESGALPPLPGARGSSSVVALVATEGAFAAGWVGEVALQLAQEWSSKGARLVLADGGLEVPCLHSAAGLALGEGLVDALRWGASVRHVARRIEGKSFFVITAGTATADGLAVLEDARWAALCSGFREAGVTLAVLVPISDPCVRGVLAQATAGVILATRSEDASDVLPGWDRPILGVVGREPPPPPPAPADPPQDAPAPATIDFPEAVEAVEAVPEDMPAPAALDFSEEVDVVVAPAQDAPAPEPALPAFDFPESVDVVAAPPADVDEPARAIDFAPDVTAAPPPAEEARSLWEVPGRLDAVPEPDEAFAPALTPLSEVAREEPAPSVGPSGAQPQDVEEADAEAHLFESLEDGPEVAVPTFEEIVQETESEPPRYVQERKSRGWVLPLGFLLVLVAGTGGAWWLGYLEIPGIPRPGGTPEAPASEAVAPASVATAPAAETSELMGFSVSLGSYRDQGTADQRASELAALVPGVLFTTAPVLLDGEVIHRVLAGPAPDSGSAVVLGTRVAEAAGLGPSDWVARATRRAFELGEMPELDAALRRSEVLRGLGVPSYVLAVSYDDGSVRFRVYAGAYADETEASYLSGLLQERGLSSATFSERTGRLPE